MSNDRKRKCKVPIWGHRGHRIDFVAFLKLTFFLFLSSLVTADKVVLVKARKQKRIEANNLSIISERRGFPVNHPLRMITATELDEDFSAMGVRQTCQN